MDDEGVDRNLGEDPQPHPRLRGARITRRAADHGRGGRAASTRNAHADQERQDRGAAMITLDVLGTPAPKGSNRAMVFGGRARFVPGGSKTNQANLKSWD